MILTWVLEAELRENKTHSGPHRPTSTECNADLRTLRGQRRQSNIRDNHCGRKEVKTSLSAHFDGKDYPYTYSGTEGNFTHIALKRVDRYTWEAENKSKGKVTNAGTNTVSKDGKTLTYTFKGTNAQGEPNSGSLVFEKQ